MDRETIQLLLDTGKALTPSTVKSQSEPDFIYFQRNAEGDLERVRAEAWPCAHKAGSLETIVEKANEKKEHVEKQLDVGDGPEVWYNRSGVTLLLDKNDRRDRVDLKLELSQQLLKLISLANSQVAFQQVGLIRELRITFKDCLGAAGNIVDILRRVKFNATQSADASIQHGKSSLGKLITAEVTGTGILPEYITLYVPVFAAANLAMIRANVECALEPDANTATFQLIPLPGELEEAIALGEAKLGEKLAEGLKDVPHFLGIA